MKNKGTLICFLGSRGSGKTTIANILAESFKNQGKTCARQHPGFRKHPILPSLITATYLWRFLDFKMMKYFGFIGRSKKGRPSLYRLYLPLALNHDLIKFSKGKTDFLIYDSNILRGIIAAYDSKQIKKEEILDLYNEKILSKTSETVFVVVNTDSNEAVSRWINRDGVQLSENDRAQEIENRNELIKRTNAVIDVLSELPNSKIIYLDGYNSPEENANKIINSI